MAKKKISATEPEPEATPLLDLDDFGNEPEVLREQTQFLFELDPEKVARWEARGIDPTPAWFTVARIRNGKQFSLGKQFPATKATHEFLQGRVGPGDYWLVLKNITGTIIDRRMYTIDEEERPENQADGFSSASPNLDMNKLVNMLLVRALAPPPPPTPDPTSNAVADMIKLMQLEHTMQARRLADEMRAKAPSETLQEKLYTLTEKAMLQASSGKGGAGGIQEILPILTLGMQLGKQIQGGGGGKEKEDLPAWAQIAPDIADSVGVPFIVACAQAILPPEKAQLVIDSINQHSAARKAEADAEPVVETTGVPVA